MLLMTQVDRKAHSHLGSFRRAWGLLTDGGLRALQKRAAEGTLVPGSEAAPLGKLGAQPDHQIRLDAHCGGAI